MGPGAADLTKGWAMSGSFSLSVSLSLSLIPNESLLHHIDTAGDLSEMKVVPTLLETRR